MNPLRIPALGRPAEIGDIYDVDKARFLNLFKSSPTTATRTVREIQHKYFCESTFRDKFNVFGIPPELQLHILGHVLAVEGSGKYLYAKKKGEKSIQAGVAFKVSKETLRVDPESYESLCREHPPDIELRNKYVVTEVTYGGMIVVTVEDSNEDDRDRSVVVQELTALLVPLTQLLEGIPVDQSKCPDADGLSWTVYSDFAEEAVIYPTFVGVVHQIENLRDSLKYGGPGKPVSYTMLPLVHCCRLSLLQSPETNFFKLPNISNDTSSFFVQLFDDLALQIQQLNDLCDVLQNNEFCVAKRDLDSAVNLQKQGQSSYTEMCKALAMALKHGFHGQHGNDAIMSLQQEFVAKKCLIPNGHLQNLLAVLDKIKLLSVWMKKGAKYCKTGDVLYSEIKNNPHVDIYIFHYSSTARLKQDNWPILENAFLTMLNAANRGQVVLCLVCDRDFDRCPSTSTTARICLVRDKTIISKDIFADGIANCKTVVQYMDHRSSSFSAMSKSKEKAFQYPTDARSTAQESTIRVDLKRSQKSSENTENTLSIHASTSVVDDVPEIKEGRKGSSQDAGWKMPKDRKHDNVGEWQQHPDNQRKRRISPKQRLSGKSVHPSLKRRTDSTSCKQQLPGRNFTPAGDSPKSTRGMIVPSSNASTAKRLKTGDKFSGDHLIAEQCVGSRAKGGENISKLIQNLSIGDEKLHANGSFSTAKDPPVESKAASHSKTTDGQLEKKHTNHKERVIVPDCLRRFIGRGRAKKSTRSRMPCRSDQRTNSSDLVRNTMEARMADDFSSTLQVECPSELTSGNARVENQNHYQSLDEFLSIAPQSATSHDTTAADQLDREHSNHKDGMMVSNSQRKPTGRVRPQTSVLSQIRPGMPCHSDQGTNTIGLLKNTVDDQVAGNVSSSSEMGGDTSEEYQSLHESHPSIQFEDAEQESGHYPSTAINVLLLGESGVGKSTWINGVSNYLAYSTVEEAACSKPVHVINSSFLLTDDDYNDVLVSMGPEGDGKGKLGSSATQSSSSYKFSAGGREVCLIDTPGIGDTRGVDKDQENFRNIIDHLSSFREIHGICILMKPNSARMNTAFQFCIRELLRHLHKDACKNIVFVFTNSRGTFYRPGDTFPTLAGFLTENKVDILLGSERVYCMDNEPVRFLAATNHGVKFTELDKANYSRSWEVSKAETDRLIRHIVDLKPHAVKRTLHIHRAIHDSLAVTGPIINISKDIQAKILYVERYLQSIKRQMDRRTDGQMGPSGTAEAPKKQFSKKIVCCNSSCRMRKQQQRGSEIICHSRCESNFRPREGLGNEDIQICEEMDIKTGMCGKCGCSWRDHECKTYEAEPEVSPKSGSSKDADSAEKFLQVLREEQKFVLKTVAKLAVFLKQNAISSSYDVFLEQLEQRLEEQQELIAIGGSNSEYSALTKVLDIYEKEVGSLQDELQHGLSLEEIQNGFNEIKRLYN